MLIIFIMAQDYSLIFTKNVSLVTLNNIKSDSVSLHKIFDIVSKENIFIDMISQTAPLNHTVNLSFTVNDDDIAKIISIIYKFKEVFSSLTTQILSNNTKILISAEKMKSNFGIAEKIFRIFADEEIQVSLITTADTEISVLVADEFSLCAKEVLMKNLKC